VCAWLGVRLGLARALYRWYRHYGMTRWDAWRLSAGLDGRTKTRVILSRDTRRSRRAIFGEAVWSVAMTALLSVQVWANQDRWTPSTVVGFLCLVICWAVGAVRGYEDVLRWRRWLRERLEAREGMARVVFEDARLVAALTEAQRDLPAGAAPEQVVDVDGRETLEEFARRVEQLLSKGPMGDGGVDEGGDDGWRPPRN
jgi:hypothetical protein